jgi:hypothetical protein
MPQPEATALSLLYELEQAFDSALDIEPLCDIGRPVRRRSEAMPSQRAGAEPIARKAHARE